VLDPDPALTTVNLGLPEIYRRLQRAQIPPASLDIYGASVCRIRLVNPAASPGRTEGPKPSKVSPSPGDSASSPDDPCAPASKVKTLGEILLQRIAHDGGFDPLRLKVKWHYRYEQFLRRPYDRRRYRIEPRSHLSLGQVSFKITEIPPGTNPPSEVRANAGKSFYVTGNVRYLCKAVVARRELRPGDVITADDVKTDIVEVSNLAQPGITDIEEVLGKEVARTIPANQPLRGEMIRKLIVIHRRDPVDIVARFGLITITLRGIALEDGAQGDIISIANKTNSANIVHGKVIDTGLVEIVSRPALPPDSPGQRLSLARKPASFSRTTAGRKPLGR